MQDLLQPLFLAVEVEVTVFKQPQLLQEAVIRISCQSLRLDELEGVIERHREDSHYVHYD